MGLLVKQHEMAVALGTFHVLDRQRRAVLAARTPDDVDQRTVALFHEARAERNVAMPSFAHHVGDRTRDPCGVCRACHSRMLAQLLAFLCSPAHSPSDQFPRVEGD